tara:strand:- start:20240 stop:20743 length:504 start_codon:yes stop_codon:yes gene_type:complete
MDLNYKGIQYDTYEKLYLGIVKEFNAKKIDIDEFRKLLDEVKKMMEKENYLKLIKWWEDFDTKLKTHKDVPTLDIFGKDYQKYVIPALLRNGAIPKKDIKDGHFYYGEWRRGQFGKFNKQLNYFEMWRHKFGDWRLDRANHFEDDDDMALFTPIKEITEEQFNNRKL